MSPRFASTTSYVCAECMNMCPISSLQQNRVSIAQTINHTLSVYSTVFSTKIQVFTSPVSTTSWNYQRSPLLTGNVCYRPRETRTLRWCQIHSPIERELELGSDADPLQAQREARRAPSDVAEGGARVGSGGAGPEENADLRRGAGPDVALHRLQREDVVAEHEPGVLHQLQ